MIKKLLYFLSFFMLGYAVFVIRMKPANLFQKENKMPLGSTSNKEAESDLDVEAPEEVPQVILGDKVRPPIIDKVTGDVILRRSGRAQMAEVGLVLKFDDQIETGKGSVGLIKFAKNSTIKLFSNSSLRINLIQAKGRSSNNLQYNIFGLDKGAMLVDFVNHKNGHFLELSSTAAKLQVKGTQFLFLHNETKARSQLALREGSIRAFASGMEGPQIVRAGEGVLIRPGSEVSSPESDSWVKKINWKKISKGSGIELFDPTASHAEQKLWKQRRIAMQELGSSAPDRPVRMAKRPTGFFKKALETAKSVGGNLEKMATKGAGELKSASPLGLVNESAEQMQNFEQVQKDKLKELNSIGEEN